MSIFGPTNPDAAEQEKIEANIKKVAALKLQEAAAEKAMEASIAAEEEKQAEKRRAMQESENALAKMKRESKGGGWF
jgi:hypothetical protein